MTKYLLPILLLLTLTPTMGCLLKRPAEAMYCERRTPDKKHCEKWADHHPYPCVHDAYGDCTPSSR